MSIPIHDQDPLQSALKDGIVIGILACLKQFQLGANKTNVALVLHSQQKWSAEEIEYFIKFFGLK